MKRILFALVICLLVSVHAATIYAPAVDAQGNGVLTRIEASAQPGKGDVFVSVEPLTGTDTQSSEKLAVKIAAEKAGVDASKYDFLFKIHSDAEVVDGPSAGAALTLLAYAELTHKTPRADLVLTGTIEADGSIGEVGGVFEKAMAVGQSGDYGVFLVPRGQLMQNGVDLSPYAQTKWGLQVVEVQDVDSLVDFAFNTKAGQKLVADAKPVPPLTLVPANPPAQVEPLRQVGERLISQLVAASARVPNDGRSQAISASLSDAVNLSSRLVKNGYYYSAANTAFLALIMADQVQAVNRTRAAARDVLTQLRAQADAINFTVPRQGGWEWLVAGKLRKYWALERMDADEQSLPVVAPDYLAEDFSLSKSWLEAARQFNGIAQGVLGPDVNELSVRGLADAYLTQAEGLARSGKLDSEGLDHVASARAAFQDGEYLTAAFDLQFAIKYSDAQDQAEGLSYVELLQALCGDNLTLSSPCLEPKNYTSVWASLYYDHGRYYVQEANRTHSLGALTNAAKMFQLAAGVEELGREAKEAFANPGNSTGVRPPSGAPASNRPGRLHVSVTTPPQAGEMRNFLLFGVVAVIVLLALLLVVLRRHSTPSAAPASDYRRRLDRAEALMLEGKLSEANYERLRSKYEELMDSKASGGDGAPELVPRRKRLTRK